MIASLSPPIHSLEIIGSTIVLDTAGLGGGGGVKNVGQKKKSQSPGNINSPPPQSLLILQMVELNPFSGQRPPVIDEFWHLCVNFERLQ